MPCPCSTRCSAAAAEASNPLASDALAIRRNVRWRCLESWASIASRSLSGKSPRIGLSPHARVFLASAGSSEAGFLTVPGSFVFRQIEVDVFGG